jgi:putative membrane protein
MWHTGEGMGWWMVFGGALWLLFWAAVIYVVVQVSRGWSNDQRPTDQPIDIARRRYAAGEITKEQFDELRNDLTGHAA